jgi:hypothetical protein
VSQTAGIVLVDSNVLLDVLTEDPVWLQWSSAAPAAAALAINPLVYAEVSVGFERIEELDEALPPEAFSRIPLPWTAAFIARKSFFAYRGPAERGDRHSGLLHRRSRGRRRDDPPHAGANRYRRYSPRLALIPPDRTHRNPR